MRNTAVLVMIVLVEALGILFALISLYSSPTGEVEGLPAAIFYLGASLFIFAQFYNLDLADEKDNLLRFIFIILAITIALYTLTFELIILYAYPDRDASAPLATSLLFLLSFVLNILGLFFMLRHNPKIINEVQNEK